MVSVKNLVVGVVGCKKFYVISFLESCFVHVVCLCKMGVKHHSPLGGKRCLGEGVSWAHPCS